ncbi:hypothetical protein EAI_03879 [Harpegnathos saltator]|uniref:Uncharacterized protein n=1 Tax=Harpegnathos saltator TaxID=610380 RepID=E2C7K1_HARSA|nr:hypothetical protein EAI_03879 [Harpegnathos saltator]
MYNLQNSYDSNVERYASEGDGRYVRNNPHTADEIFSGAAEIARRCNALVKCSVPYCEAYLKHKLRGKRVCTLKQLIRQIRLIWKYLPNEYAVNLVESMPRRCQAIINAGGDWTHY